MKKYILAAAITLVATLAVMWVLIQAVPNASTQAHQQCFRATSHNMDLCSAIFPFPGNSWLNGTSLIG
ncbi:hypothetical protein [Leifsonia sp. Leaf264]|uniref:hypothetical protein n=1 Tax=Leifsonia sp. Leaf264 TaxID=1736314 RepID=UPI0006F87F6F|nr:hypothetical protein [Leifsonia sp. Leaf264]KQO98599.1 hypothetical protein ASF30_11090 [Leifsonia sp. Leaf264]